MTQAFEVKDRYDLNDFVLLVKKLRDKDEGCPWDKVQTHASIRQNFIEEVYEAVEAIDKEDDLLLKEELGDVLLQVALHAEISSETGSFDLLDVANTLCKKLVLRHPHIFADVAADSSIEVLANWEDIKRVEKQQQTATQAIEDLPNALPPLMKSQKVQKRAAYVGFDYRSIDRVICDLEHKMERLKTEIEQGEDITEEIGDILFTAVAVARLGEVDASLAAERACERYIERFTRVEAVAIEQSIDMKQCDDEQLAELWNNAKRH
ncbi:MAG: nucleoside triphosphate pyrophosphohydrolase [Oscillospiraceae bacterium]|nr:nucleoside triphosphate pyrophosphohydrolase [Oscillospiraceae bacterium]